MYCDAGRFVADTTAHLQAVPAQQQQIDYRKSYTTYALFAECVFVYGCVCAMLAHSIAWNSPTCRHCLHGSHTCVLAGAALIGLTNFIPINCDNYLVTTNMDRHKITVNYEQYV